jgi:hypothetical protein
MNFLKKRAKFSKIRLVDHMRSAARSNVSISGCFCVCFWLFFLSCFRAYFLLNFFVFLAIFSFGACCPLTIDT